jgi:hypothetical protein
VAADHDGEFVADRHRLQSIVRDENGRRARGAQDGAKFRAQRSPCRCVERAERLVEQQQRRRGRERAGERHALGLAARQVSRQARLEPCGPNQPDDRVGLLPLHDGGGAPQAVLDVRAYREMRKKGGVLANVSDPAPLGRSPLPRLRIEPGHIVYLYAAAVGPQQACNRTQHGRLAGTGRPEQHEDGSGRQRAGERCADVNRAVEAMRQIDRYLAGHTAQTDR